MIGAANTKPPVVEQFLQSTVTGAGGVSVNGRQAPHDVWAHRAATEVVDTRVVDIVSPPILHPTDVEVDVTQTQLVESATKGKQDA